MNIAILPTQKSLYKNKIFDISSSRDNVLERFVLLKKSLEKKGHRCYTYDQFDESDVDVIIFTRFDHQAGSIFKAMKKSRNIRLVYTAIEPSIICPLHEKDILGTLPIDNILTWNDNVVRKYAHVTKCNIGEPVITVESIPSVDFSRKKLCCMVATNKVSNENNELYSERLNAIRYFSLNNVEFDLYGIGWDVSTDPDVLLSFRGAVDEKKAVMKQYKFAICYENTKDELGLITEKIFDCFSAGCVPIYRGASNIRKYIPENCFVDLRDFHSYDDLYTFMISMSVYEYDEYLDAVKAFLKSERYTEFTSESYVNNVEKTIYSLRSSNKIESIFYFKFKLMVHVVKNFKYYLSNISRLKRYIYDLAVVW